MAMTSAAPALPLRDDGGRHLWLLAALGLLGGAAAAGYALAVGEVEALFLVLAALTCVAVLFDFRIGAVVLVMMLPAADTPFLPHALLGITGMNPINLLLAGTLGAYVLRGRLQKAGTLVPARIWWLYILPIVVGGLLGMRHVDDIVPYFYESEVVKFTNAFGYLRDMMLRPLIMVFIALVFGAAVARSKKPERFIWLIAASVWVVILIQLGYIAYTGVRLGALGSARARTFFDAIGIHANDLGRLYVIAYALLLFVWWETKHVALKHFLFVTMGAMTFALMLTFSRGAYVGFLLVNVWLLAWKFNAKTLSLALLCVALALLLLPNAVHNRILVGFDTGEADAVSAGRIDGIWLPLLPEALNSPLWGNGLSSLMWSYAMETGAMLPVGHPHNAFLEALLDIGLLGLGLMLAFFWHVWQNFRKLGGNAYLSPELRGFFQGATAGLLAFLVTCMAGSSLRPSAEATYLWLAIGMMYGILARRPAN